MRAQRAVVPRGASRDGSRKQVLCDNLRYYPQVQNIRRMRKRLHRYEKIPVGTEDFDPKNYLAFRRRSACEAASFFSGVTLSGSIRIMM